ncbi:hypothetical protein BDF20DRAFT_837462 [Mycotypha africana]|uniref:uncharacterized protein n=1 Tax=Mycotypha africana TaxID=64632 RepID=UPI002300C65B|nr:uncharacterized protein BDF20DRAFT_837462 [Mycotypha africana]KAI8973525.1 hypothetical protein BDF20DRAFT_837462 [Mycotypha africana]
MIRTVTTVMHSFMTILYQTQLMVSTVNLYMNLSVSNLSKPTDVIRFINCRLAKEKECKRVQAVPKYIRTEGFALQLNTALDGYFLQHVYISIFFVSFDTLLTWVTIGLITLDATQVRSTKCLTYPQ